MIVQSTQNYPMTEKMSAKNVMVPRIWGKIKISARNWPIETNNLFDCLIWVCGYVRGCVCPFQ